LQFLLQFVVCAPTRSPKNSKRRGRAHARTEAVDLCSLAGPGAGGGTCRVHRLMKQVGQKACWNRTFAHITDR